MKILFLLYTLFFTALIVTSYKKPFKKYYTLIKFLTSFLFIVIATYGMFISKNTDFYFNMLPPLLMCLLGDVLLGLSNDKKSKNLFLSGLFSFLTAHILFILGFNSINSLSLCDFILPLLIVLITFKLCNIKKMNVQNMRYYILIYSFFVSLLFFKSVNLVFVTTSMKTLLLCVGSFLFFISDTIILFLYFYEHKHHLTCFFNLLTYYYGMFLIALSISY